MRKLAGICMLAATIALGSGCTLWREKKTVNHWADATGGEGLERSFWKDVEDKNWNDLRMHLAGNYVAISAAESSMDRDATLQHLQQLQLEDYSLGDFQVELNSDTLVVTYTVTMHGRLAGQPLPPQPIRMMTVWQKQKAGWLAIAHSVVEPKGS